MPVNPIAAFTGSSTVAGVACVACMLAVATAAPLARAEATETRIAHAYRRFHDGEQLFEAKKYVEACAAFEESQKLDPTLGTLLNMAYCHETLGLTATAWGEYNAAAAWAAAQSRPDREKFALDHASDLAKRLSRVQIELPLDIEGLEVQVDGLARPAALVTSMIFLDPGPHALRVTAPGKQPYSARLDVPSGPSAQTVHVPVPSNAMATVLVSPTPGSGLETPAEGTRTAGLVVVGLGVVGLGVGTYFGIRTLDKKTTGRAHCDGSQCDATGVAAFDDAHTSSTVSTVAFGAGFAALGAGLWLMLRRPTAPATPATANARLRPLVGASSVGVGVEGGW